MTSLGANYNRLWLAAGISNLGDGVRAAALPLLAASLTRDPALVAGVAFAESLPWLLFALIGGAVADRVDRRALMGNMQLTRMTLAVVLAATIFTGTASLLVVYVVAFLAGTAEVFFDNTAQTVLPSVVPKDKLELANSRLYGAEIITDHFLGPPLGGFLFALAIGIPFLFDGLSFAVSGVLILAMTGSFRTHSRAPASGSTIGSEIREGLDWLWNHHLLRTFAALLGTMLLLWTSASAILVLFALEILNLEGPGFGVLLTATAAGSLLSTFVTPRLKGLLGDGPSLFLAVMLFGGGQLIIGLTSNSLVVAVMLAALGFGTVLWNVITVSLRQSIIPDHLLGRVNSVYRFVGWGTMPLGAALGGFLGRTIGLRAPFVVGGVLILLLGLAMLPVVNSRSIGEARLEAQRRP